MNKNDLNIRPFDPANYLENQEDIQNYLKVVLEEDGIDALPEALQTIFRSEGWKKINQYSENKLEWQNDGHLSFELVIKILNQLGLNHRLMII